MSGFYLVAATALSPPEDLIVEFRADTAITLGTVTMAQTIAPGSITADTTFTVAGDSYTPAQTQLAIVATTGQSLTVTVNGANPNAAVTFSIDGTAVGTVVTDSLGGIAPTSILVPSTLATGTHTLLATQTGDALTASVSFDWTSTTNAPDVVRGPDQAPVEVPAAILPTGRRWVFQDLMPGGLGSYVLEQNPSSWVAPNFTRTLASQHSTAQSGKFHIFEPWREPFEWSFRGLCPTQAMHDKLRAFGDLNRRFYVIDHRGRAWITTFVKVELVARRRTNYQGTASDWVHDYTVTALVYDENPRTPA